MTSPSIDELFASTLEGDYDDDAPWEAIRALRKLGTRDVFEIAAAWCKSDDPLKRARGIDVLSQLGKTADHPVNCFRTKHMPSFQSLCSTNLRKAR